MLVDIAAKAKEVFAANIAPLGLPVPLARAIVMLGQPAPMGALAEQLDCDPSYITGLADQMEQRGLVERVTGGDRRVKLLALTPAGQQTRDQIATIVASTALVQAKLGDSERKALASLLEKLLS